MIANAVSDLHEDRQGIKVIPFEALSPDAKEEALGLNSESKTSPNRILNLPPDVNFTF